MCSPSGDLGGSEDDDEADRVTQVRLVAGASRRLIALLHSVHVGIAGGLVDALLLLRQAVRRGHVKPPFWQRPG